MTYPDVGPHFARVLAILDVTEQTQPGNALEETMNTSHITSARRHRGAVAARPWLSAVLLGLTAAASMWGSARAVDLDLVLRGKWPPYARGLARDVAVSGQYPFVATAGGGLQVIDRSNPASPQRVGGYDVFLYLSGVAVSGDYAYVTASGGGLQVIDVSDPANPRRVGGNSSFTGASVFAGSNQVFVAAGGDGLVILHPFTPWSGPPLSFRRVPAGPKGMDLVLEGLPGLRVDLERSSDLHHWQSWTNTLLGTGPSEVADPEANPWQSYRATAR